MIDPRVIKFGEWWEEESFSKDNPYHKESFAYWSWEGWQAGWNANKEGESVVYRDMYLKVRDELAALQQTPCPNCERHKQSAALWRAEAYKQAGRDVIERNWVGLTTKDIHKCVVDSGIHVFEGDIYKFVQMLQDVLQEKNNG
jgi:hypothetical protein